MPFPFRDLGPCGVVFGGVDLGHSKNVRVRVNPASADVTYATQGEDPVDTILTGNPTEVQVDMIGSTLTQMAAVALNGTVTGDQLMFASNVGTSLRDNAKMLILKPYVNGAPTTDQTRWLTFFLAAPVFSADLAFDVTTNRILSVVFKVFRCLTSGEIASGETYGINDQWAIGYGQTA